MIKTLHLKAFKSYPDAEIPLKSLTLFSGLNNSGKSSLIQALRMYHRAAEGKPALLLKGHGGVREMHSHFSAKDDPIEINCTFDNHQIGTLKLSEKNIQKPKHSMVYSYVGADRLGPQPSLPLKNALNEMPDIGNQGKYVLGFLAQLEDTLIPEALIHPQAQGHTLAFVLRGWLNEIAPGIEFNFSLNKKSDSASAEIDHFRPTNVGFGLSYTLPVLAAILGFSAQAPAGGWNNNWGANWDQKRKQNGVMVIIENPEAHLHPQGQTAMGRLIAMAANCGVQMIIETHSDHLMDGIRIAVKEQLIDAKKVAFHYLSKNEEGLSEITTPIISQNGKLDAWPAGFFDQTLKNRAFLAKRD